MNLTKRLTAWLLVCIAAALGCADDPAAPKPSAAATAAPDDQGLDPVIHGSSIPFADTHVFFEFNSTDNDLGFQLFLDGEPWRRVNLIGPDRTRILDFQTRGPLRELGLTELRLESAEPSPGEVLALFDPGEYLFIGTSVEGGHLVGTGDLSHDLAPAPVFLHPEEGDEVEPTGLVVEWEPIGGLAGFEVIIANEDSGASMTVELDGVATTLQVPEEFLEEGTEYKAEVLAIAQNGNKTITEITFFTK